jgi:hypothetical protein
MATHAQTWVKVNAPVDSGIAELISVLNSRHGLETLQSCQGGSGQHGYVYFSFGEWQKLCRFVFDEMAPHLHKHLGEDVKLEIMAAESSPIAKLSFSAEATSFVTSALKEVVTA